MGQSSGSNEYLCDMDHMDAADRLPNVALQGSHRVMPAPLCPI
jgi:hypothetical protein